HYPKAQFIDSTSVAGLAGEVAGFDVRDAPSGKLRHRLLHDHSLTIEQDARISADRYRTPDRRFVIFRGFHWAGRQLDLWERCWNFFLPNSDEGAHHVYVTDLRSGRVRFRLPLSAGDDCYLSNDGSMLVTVEFRENAANGGLIQVWDVCRT